MVYDEQPAPSVYLTLPLPDAQLLAKGVRRPSHTVCDTIVTATAMALNQSPDASIDLYRLHADLLPALPNVTIGQVARVVLDTFKVAP